MDLEELVTQLSGSEDIEVDDTEDLVDEMELMNEQECNKVQRRVKPISVVLVKLCHIAFKIIHSSTLLLPAWRRVLEELEMIEKQMPHDVTTQWNSTYDMTSFSGDYQLAIDTMMAKKLNGLWDFELSADEWKIVCQLTLVLKILKDATKFFSRHDVPNLATVIPAMDYINSKFSSFIASPSLDPAI
ncbi:hypothetical protein VKT23_012140 [Stygiomarasmius scandens]|uniref:Uncharacterized protein n=1 Tax=Marasmiellus scandens TaxID=2682957 RepID=A0ABR1J7S2_9AGAR